LKPESKNLRKYASSYIVPSVDKALRILSLVKKEGREMAIYEIAEATGLNKSTVLRLTLTLENHGMLKRNRMNKRYSLGMELLEYGQAVLNNLDTRHAAKSFMKNLVHSTGETAVLSILHGTKMVISDVEESRNQLRVALSVGLISPATTTSNGKAVLAWLPKSRVHEILRAEGLPALTKKSITNPEAYQAELAGVRRRGYATDFEECNEGAIAVSAPLFGSKREVIGAISVIGPAFRMTKKNIRDYGKRCADAAAGLSTLLH
jgi:DNA-binding IclR family transcriptional regulator